MDISNLKSIIGCRLKDWHGLLTVEDKQQWKVTFVLYTSVIATLKSVCLFQQ